MAVDITSNGRLSPSNKELGGSHDHSVTWHNKSDQYPAVVNPPKKLEWEKIFTQPYPGEIHIKPGGESQTYTLQPEPRQTGKYPYTATINKIEMDGTLEVEH